MKTVPVLGARPQFSKASVVSHALSGCGGVDEVLVHTGSGDTNSTLAGALAALRIPVAHVEWIELVEAGWNRLRPPVGADAVHAALLDALGSAGSDVTPYGKGDAATRVARGLLASLGT